MTRLVSAAILSQGEELRPRDTIAIVGDRQLCVVALAAVVLGDPTYRLVHETSGIVEAQRALDRFQPAVVVVETVGTVVGQVIEAAQVADRTLLLVDPEDDPVAFNAVVRSRAAGYLSRSSSLQALQKAIDSMRQFGHYLDPLLLGRILAVTSEPATRSRSELSSRERDILVRIANGRSTKEVAREYAIAPKTVGNHVSNIRQKLNLTHRSELVLYAVQHGLAKVELGPPLVDRTA